ncbi:MAG: DNA repair protein RecN [Ruminococcus sp.]|jgi:DNA repair protein RecN (Recombination protein N)
MLTNLHVKNLALIDETEVEFEPGLNILTGETGAGKSLLLGSINLALGKKMASGSIGKFGKYALVELIFTVENPKIAEAFEQMGIILEENQVVLSRKIMEGRSISRINGETCTVGQMKEAASLLLDIHGQHEHQSLLYPERQLDILDEFGGKKILEQKKQVESCYGSYKKIEKELKECQIDEEQRQREIDFLQFEIQEIDDASLVPGEDEELERKFRRMYHSRKIAEVLGRVHGYLGYDNGQSAGEVLGQAVRELSSLEGLDDGLDQIYQTLLDIESMLNDCNRDISGYLDDMTFSEETFQEVQNRLDEINRLKGKYGDTLEKILKYRDNQQEKLESLMHLEERKEKLEQEFQNAERELGQAAGRLSNLRKAAAKELEQAIVASLKELNFLQVEFQIAFEPLNHYTKNGNDGIRFMISTNPGEPLWPLDKVVSGGELSRIMLAVKTLMADKDDKEVLIFDEIDTGISGRTAQKVSEKMAVIAGKRQVLCITHLPQIAAMADAHFLIEKQVKDTFTTTGVKKLSEKESVKEIARILGGTEVTERILESAAEMKEMAQVVKNTRLKK